MPGKRLSDTEHRLSDWWQHSENFSFSTLRSLSIKGDPGLRGIEDIHINFDYPLTVVCGKNGSGKTTILALSVLGFHSPENHIPISARRRPKAGENYSYYTFIDFFLKGPTDPDVVGVKISWEYGGGEAKTVVIEKSPKKWMRYERRPQRPVHYLGVIRCIPAVEQSAIRSRFGARRIEFEPKPLNYDFRKRLSDIMGRPYDSAEIIFSARHSINSCTSGRTYSSFNMGAGEDILIELLYILQECPQGSLIVVEEIELGLHPEALIRLAKHLQEIIREKKLQVIVSTHSQHFIDSVPRQARILIQRAENTHTVISGPTTRLAVGLMAGTTDPELKVYCEDNFAQQLIIHSLSGELRRRCEVIPIGSNSELAKQAAYHLTAKHPQKILLIWDGNEATGDISRWIQEAGLEDGINWITLPGNETPEKWVVTGLNRAEGHELLAKELSDSSEFIGGVICDLITAIDEHDIVFRLSSKVNLTEGKALEALIRAFSKLPSDPLSFVRNTIRRALDGEIVRGNTNGEVLVKEQVA